MLFGFQDVYCILSMTLEELHSCFCLERCECLHMQVSIARVYNHDITRKRGIKPAEREEVD